jgi:hypothetical protein
MTSILNRKAIKAFILNTCEKNRPGWSCERVSKQAIDEVEGFLKHKIQQSVHRHPSVGKTFRHFD